MAAWIFSKSTSDIHLACHCIRHDPSNSAFCSDFLQSACGHRTENPPSTGWITWHRLSDVHTIMNAALPDWTPCSSVLLISPGAPCASDWHRLGGASLCDSASTQRDRTKGKPEARESGFHNESILGLPWTQNKKVTYRITKFRSFLKRKCYNI